MRRTILWAARIAAAVVVVAALAAAGLLVDRSLRQAQYARETAITTPDGIDEGRFVTLGGVPQWVRIRGLHRSAPVLLFVHGGPGDAQSPMTALYAPWERDFVLVQWDQRGAGRTFGRGVRLTPDIPVERMAQDGIEFAEYLRQRLGQPKIIVMGHSWGSVLAAHMVMRRPDLFYAYVGTGQIDRWSDAEAGQYAYALAEARRAGDQRQETDLARLGPPPYADAARYEAMRGILNARLDPSDRRFLGLEGLDRQSEPALVFTSPGMSLRDDWDWFAGLTQTALNPPRYPGLTAADLGALGYDFPVPVVIIQGREDHVTPTDLAVAYFQRIRAPKKALFLVDGGHFAAMTHVKEVGAILDQEVRPLAAPQARNTRPPPGA
jgi:pimeloyl-ACP methyl ester carboxylesterase